MVGCIDEPSIPAERYIEHYHTEVIPHLTKEETERERERCLEFKRAGFWNCRKYMASIQIKNQYYATSCKAAIVILNKYPNGCEMLYGKE